MFERLKFVQTVNNNLIPTSEKTNPLSNSRINQGINIKAPLHTSHVALLNISLTIFTKTQSTRSDHNFFTTLPSKLSPNSQLLPSAAYSRQSSSHYAIFFISIRRILYPAYLHEKDERSPTSNLHSSKHYSFPRNSNKHNASHCTPPC
jgi:hypothetical protein